MAEPNFESMTLDELDAWNVAKKAELLALQGEYASSNEARRAKVQQWHVDEAERVLKEAATASGRTVEKQAIAWLTEDAPDEGHKKQVRLLVQEGRLSL